MGAFKRGQTAGSRLDRLDASTGRVAQPIWNGGGGRGKLSLEAPAPFEDLAMAEQPRKMTRAEREQELRQMLGTPTGMAELRKLAREAAGLAPGQIGQVGSDIVETILAKEYPNG